MAPPRRSPYKHVEVRGIVWEGCDLNRAGAVRNSDQELHMVLGAFRHYGYNAQHVEIPADPGKRSGFSNMMEAKLRRLSSGASRTLVILYYQGHGGLDKEGHLFLSK